MDTVKLKSLIRKSAEKLLNEDATDNTKDTFYIGNCSVFIKNNTIHLESSTGKTKQIQSDKVDIYPDRTDKNMLTTFYLSDITELLQFLSENN